MHSSPQFPILVVLNEFCLFYLFHTWFHHPFTHLARQVLCSLHLPMLPANFPVCIYYSMPSFFIICMRYSNSLFLILCISILFVYSFFKFFSMLTCSIHGILKILLCFKSLLHLSKIHCHICVLILHELSVLFYLYLTKRFCSLIFCLAIVSHHSLSACAFRFQCRTCHSV